MFLLCFAIGFKFFVVAHSVILVAVVNLGAL